MSPMDSENLVYNQPSELVSDHDFKSAVGLLNILRFRRVENLEDGYNVSVILCSDFDSPSNMSDAVS